MIEAFNTSSPHIKEKIQTKHIMLLVMIALLPNTVFGIWHFGLRSLLLIVLSIGTSVGTEYLYEKALKKEITISDGSAALTGLLLALNLPVGVKWWIPVIGGFVAIFVVKQLFGGLGQNILNPALAAKCMLLLFFTGQMTNYSSTSFSTTPLSQLKDGNPVEMWAMLVGKTPGTIGVTSTIFVLLGASILLAFGIIEWKIPGFCLLSFVIFISIFGSHSFDMSYITAHLCAGGLMLGVWFMATDYATSPITKRGKILYGILLGIIVGIFRIFIPTYEDITYAIIIGNVFVPLIEKVTIPKPFGYKKVENN